MSEIVVRKDGDKWCAFFNDKAIASSKCRPCVVHSIKSVTKKSEKYKTLVVMNEDGTTKERISIGIHANGPATQNL
jgi:hypothetical protein